MLIRQPRSTAMHRRRARPLLSASCILDLQEKQTALAAADADLAQAKKTFTVSQVQYTRGMISKMAYTDALDTFTTAQETEVAARIDLLTAYNTYQWQNAV